MALYNESKKYDDPKSVAQKILRVALRAPYEQILQNAGLPVAEVVGAYSHGLNVKTNELGDMYDMGVIDPLKVTRSALENAVSVATTILSTNAIITMARSVEEATTNTVAS